MHFALCLTKWTRYIDAAHHGFVQKGQREGYEFDIVGNANAS